MGKRSKAYYQKLFAQYPDVVDVPQFCTMLGGISNGTAWKLIREDRVQHISYIDNRYLIPKEWVIDYVLSDHYSVYKKELSVQI